MLKPLFKIFLYSIFCFPFFIITGCAIAPALAIPATPPPPPKIKTPPDVAVVLGGGGARGMAHIGVLKVLQEEHIPIDLIVGTSAGSIIGALYAANPNPALLQTTVFMAGISDLMDISPSLEGPITGNALQNFILLHTGIENFRQLRIPFVAVATDLETGETVPLYSGPVAPAVNASAALPPVFHPVSLYGRVLVDGGVSDLIPVDVAKLYHPKVIIAVNVTPDLSPFMPANIIGVYNRAYTISDQRFAQFNMRSADIVLHPKVGQTGVFDSSNRIGLVRAGEKAALQALPQICALLREKHIPSRCS
jgi:NTE family protein